MEDLILADTSLAVLKIENEAKRVQNEVRHTDNIYSNHRPVQAVAKAKEITERATYLAKQTVEQVNEQTLSQGCLFNMRLTRQGATA